MKTPARLREAAEAMMSPAYVITIPGEPVAKRRPRLGNGRRYTHPADVEAEASTAAILRATLCEPLTGNLAVGCEFYRSTRRRVDVDNLLKHVFDAGNKVAWVDDSQCTAAFGVIELDRANPRTVIFISSHSSSLVRE
ncbi:RusA family crossover junction endodeoxyribonuclease [Nocardia sp. FBN12]|uniref:RusA family crossover junction endodeoxyribonuclease n=1 Tax=Nocardia sp. FBN12 TaxID=3419766 RepID=UPI003D0946E9